MIEAATDTDDQANRGAGVSGSLNELQGRMLARRRQSRIRSRAVGGLILAVVVSGLGLAAVPLWQHAGSWKPVASHAESVIQAGWGDLFGVPAGDGPQRADPEPPASD